MGEWGGDVSHDALNEVKAGPVFHGVVRGWFVKGIMLFFEDLKHKDIHVAFSPPPTTTTRVWLRNPAEVNYGETKGRTWMGFPGSTTSQAGAELEIGADRAICSSINVVLSLLLLQVKFESNTGE
ncbi:uncharacterized protein V6R79_021366 [Siganus canaliculatus]